MTSLDESLAREMEGWESASLRRRIDDEPSGRVDFTSNDYLGFARHPGIVAAAREALERHGAGGRASRLLGGGSPLHRAAERAAAEWLGAEDALLFTSGYQANLGLIGALVGRGDALFSDAHDHASLIDAARVSRARVFVHAHLDLDELAHQLARARTARRRLVVTEGVFSMDGDAPDLDELARLCARHDASLVVDEAHAVGLIGPEGAGAWAASGGGDEAVLAARVVTGGKALGAGGAFVVGSAVLRDHLVNHARSFVFTTAPPPAVAGALCAAVELARAADEPRERALSAAAELARRIGRPRPAAAIVPVVVGDEERALSLARSLGKKGLDVRAIRPPSVPPGTSRLRVACHAFNTAAEIDELARGIGEVPDAPAVAGVRARGVERALFVCGTDTGIGKTVVSALLLRAARALGPAAYWKPVQTGSDDDTHTVGELAEAAPHELLRPAWSLALPASPHEAAADAGLSIDPRRIEEGLGGLLRMLPDARLIVELAGGLLVPYRLEPEPATQADWLERSGAPVVLVARSGLGTLNHTLLTLESLRARHLEPRALFLVGAPHASNAATLRALGGVEHVLEVPLFDELGPEALRAWLAAVDLAGVLGA